MGYDAKRTRQAIVEKTRVRREKNEVCFGMYGSSLTPLIASVVHKTWYSSSLTSKLLIPLDNFEKPLDCTLKTMSKSENKESRESKRHSIQRLLQVGCSIKQIAELVGVTERTVYNCKTRIEDGESLQDHPRSGRPHLLTKSEESKLVQLARRQSSVSRPKLAAALMSSTHKKVSPTTISEVLHKHGLKSKTYSTKPKLTARNIKARLAFCKEFKDFDWEQAVFVDESPFSFVRTINTQNERYWGYAGEYKQKDKKSQDRRKIAIYAGISATGRTKLFFYEGNLTGEAYLSLLKRLVIDVKKNMYTEDEEWSLFQDGARPHVYWKVQKFLHANCPNFCPKDLWPGNSPDLNPIENVFSIMGEELKSKRYKNLDGLKRHLKKIWAEISQETISACILSMPQRIKQTRQNRGGSIKY